MKTRKELLQRVEGKAQVRDRSGRWQMLVSMRADRQFWLEIRSPLGGPFAVLRADEEWVEFLIPRRKEHYRIPAAEFWRSSARQRKFLDILPVRIRPELMMDLILGRLDPDDVAQCQWNADSQSYALLTKAGAKKSYFLLDPLSYFPKQSGRRGDDFFMIAKPGAIMMAENQEFASVFDVYHSDRVEMTFEWIELSSQAQLGEKPPLFPESSNLKRIDY